MIRSERAGVGKSLRKKRLCQNLEAKNRNCEKPVSIPLQERNVQTATVLNTLLQLIKPERKMQIIHIDISHEVTFPTRNI